MTTLRQAAQAALDKLNAGELLCEVTAASILNEALEAPEQEPVAYWVPKAEQFCLPVEGAKPFGKAWKPLYAAPLEAPDIKALQAEGKGPAPCARFCEANAFQNAIRQAERERDALMAAGKLALDALEDIQGSIEFYHRNGPDWTHKDGTEVFGVGVLTDRQEDIDAAAAALRSAGVSA